MRPDMAKVIVERPRHGSKLRGMGKGYWRKLQRLKVDELPKREPIKQARSKSFNEHLGPLRRYLRKQVGRPWNKINSELRTQIGRDSVVNNHVFTHVFQYVAVNVVERDGVLYEAEGYWTGLPLGYWGFPLFYVCPRTGIMKLVRNRSWHERQRKKTLPQLHVPVDHEISFVRKEGVWMRIRLEAFPRPGPRDAFGMPLPVHDALFNIGLTRAEAVKHYGRGAIAVEARPASREEIRKHCEPLKAPNRV